MIKYDIIILLIVMNLHSIQIYKYKNNPMLELNYGRGS